MSFNSNSTSFPYKNGVEGVVIKTPKIFVQLTHWGKKKNSVTFLSYVLNLVLDWIMALVIIDLGPL